MARRISLALTFHNHQPIGQFGWVMADVFAKAYEPMLDALERHPTIHTGLHYTGPLLEWIAAERPAFLDQLGTLVRRGQVELLGGGLFEPILITLPAEDRLDQLRRLADRVEEIAGARPRGAWLAERVWEPGLPGVLAEAGYHWTIVDDAHLVAAALPDDAAWSAWSTENQGRRVTVFGTDEGLRYKVPFATVEAVIDHLQAHATEAGDRLGTMGDDGEKFGGWPTTFAHCWGPSRWVDRFFEALEANASWLTTTTPSGWLATHSPRGLAYLPGGSYTEMGEWALPAEESRPFTAFLQQATKERRPERRWLRGASWRNFLVKYREANDLHKQMLRASAAVHAMPPGAARNAALDHLERGQSNDCYWHGLFGGLYLPDLRFAALRHLVAARDMADGNRGWAAVGEVVDLDADGTDEVLLSDAGQEVTVDLAEGAGIGAWDIRAARCPMLSVLRRRPESYHETLRDLEAKAQLEAKARLETEAQLEAEALETEESARTTTSVAGSTPTATAVRDPGTPASIHEIVAAKERDLSAQLHYDDHERRFGLVRFLAPEATPESVAAGSADELGDFVDGSFTIAALEPASLTVTRQGRVRDRAEAGHAVTVTKTIRLGGERSRPTLDLQLHVSNHSEQPIDARIALELPTMLLGGGGNPAAWWEVGGVRTSHDGSGAVPGTGILRQGNDDLGIAIETVVEPPGDAWWAPIETISNSEGGFERVYQGSGLVLSWVQGLDPAASFTASVRSTATVREDLAARELGAR